MIVKKISCFYEIGGSGGRAVCRLRNLTGQWAWLKQQPWMCFAVEKLNVWSSLIPYGPLCGVLSSWEAPEQRAFRVLQRWVQAPTHGQSGLEARWGVVSRLAPHKAGPKQTFVTMQRVEKVPVAYRLFPLSPPPHLHLFP